MKVAILGLGSIGRRHARCFLAAGAEEVIGFDPTEERRNQFTDEIGAEAYGDQDQVLDMRPDLVLLASPNASTPARRSPRRSGASTSSWKSRWR